MADHRSLVRLPALKRKKPDSSIFDVEMPKYKLSPEDEKLEKLPVKGREIFAHPYGTIAFVGKTGSGKSVTMFHYIKHTLDKRTKVFIISTTVTFDKLWVHARDYMDKQGIKYEHFPEIKMEGKNGKLVNVLKSYICPLMDSYVEKKYDKNGWKEDESLEFMDHLMPSKSDKPLPKRLYGLCVLNGPPAPEYQRKHDPNEHLVDRVPDFAIFFDDVSELDLKSRILTDLIKRNRHFRCRVFIGTQHLIHVKKDAWDQIHCVHMWDGFSGDYMEKMHKRVNTRLPRENYMWLYDRVTEQPHTFLTHYPIATAIPNNKNEEQRVEFRINFDPDSVDHDTVKEMDLKDYKGNF
jgi:hypothetical protein